MAYNVDFLRHYYRNIEPARLAHSDLLLSDRFTLCYKAYGFALRVRNQFVRSFLDSLIPEPDLQILMDLDLDLVLERIKTRKEPRAVDETDVILSRLISYYRRERRSNRKILVVDASQTIKAVSNELICIIDHFRRKKS